MAQSLSVTIALNGADQIRQQLADIGEAGQKAFADIGAAAEKAGGFKELDPSVVTDKLKEMGVTGVEEINKIQQAVKQASNLESLAKGIELVEGAFKALGIAAAFTLPGIAAAIASIVPRTVAWAESIQEVNAQATKLGVSVSQFDGLQKAFAAAGAGAKGVADTMAKIGQAAEKAQIDNVTQAFKTLQTAMKEGLAVSGDPLRILQEAAAGVGKAAELARQKLDELGQPLPDGVPRSLEYFIQRFGETDSAVQAFVRQMEQMPDGTQSAQFALDQLGQAGLQLFQELKSGAITADQFRNSMRGLIDESTVGKADAVTQALGQLKQAWDNFMGAGGAGADIVVGALNVLTEALKEVQAGLQATKQDWDALNGIVNTVGKAVYDFGNALGSLSWDIINAGVNAWNALVGAIQAAIDKLLQFIGLKPSGAPSGTSTSSDTAGLASGGLIGGRGTGTSDSNLAWVSRGEHIMPARAVAQPGVLAFLEALRATGGNLTAVLNGLGRFALGGLVPRPAMAFAAGGLVGMHPVTINFPGLPPISGLRATSVVVDELNRAAVLAQVRSGGRKPSRYT